MPRAQGTKGRRPAFDHVLMFTILLPQAMIGCKAKPESDADAAAAAAVAAANPTDPPISPGAQRISVPGFHRYATSPYVNMLSALGGLGNSRAFAGFSPETLMVQGRNGRAFSLRNGGFSPKLEGWLIFPTRFNALI